MPHPFDKFLQQSVNRLRSRVQKKEFLPEMIAALGMITLGISAFLYLHFELGIPRRIIGLGAASFALGAVLFKGVLYQSLVVPVLHHRLKPVPLAVAQGLISSLSELGAATLFFVLVVPTLSTIELIGFGAGAGIIEALVIGLLTVSGTNVFSGTPLAREGEDSWEIMGATPVSAALCPILERVLTLGLHIGARALVYVSLDRMIIFPALAAVTVFAAVDGTAYYGHLARWKFLRPRVAVPFYLSVALAAFLLILLFSVYQGGT